MMRAMSFDLSLINPALSLSGLVVGAPLSSVSLAWAAAR